MRKPKKKKPNIKTKQQVDRHMLLSANRATVETQIQEQKKSEDLARKNNGFTQLDDVGVSALEKLMEKSVKAGNLFLRLCREMDSKGAVVATREVLADIAQVDITNVTRILKLLDEYGLIRHVKQGGHRIIAINPDVAWRSWNSGKQYAVFNARVILRSDQFEDREDYDIRRGTALVKLAKKARGRKPKQDQAQSTFKDPMGPVETVETEVLD